MVFDEINVKQQYENYNKINTNSAIAILTPNREKMMKQLDCVNKYSNTG